MYGTRRSLRGISEEPCIITLLAVCSVVLGRGVLESSFLDELVFDLVGVAEVEGHEDAQAAAHRSGGKKSSVSWEVARGVLGLEEESTDCSSQITEADVHGDTSCTLRGASDVVSVECDTSGNVGVDSSCGEERSGILGVYVLRADQEDESKHGLK